MEGIDRPDPIALAARVIRVAGERHRRLATAESLTAGLVAATLAAVPGASSVLLGGATVYTDEIKRRVLGVSAATLAQHSAVSRETASEMAIGARRVFGADAAVSLTGFAGPDGGTVSDPVGTVYFGFADPTGALTERRVFLGGRNEVRAAATARALELLLERLCADCV